MSALQQEIERLARPQARAPARPTQNPHRLRKRKSCKHKDFMINYAPPSSRRWVPCQPASFAGGHVPNEPACRLKSCATDNWRASKTFL